MEQNPFAPAFDALPQALPVFPLTSALLLPGGQMPLNIFEPRYLQMVEDALSTNRMIGMIQPKPGQEEADNPVLEKTGCCGKIIEFSESSDGRYLITLSGVYRYDIVEELESAKQYRMVKPDWAAYKGDHTRNNCLDIDRSELKELLKDYFKIHGMDCDWKAIDTAADEKLITCLSMVCPFDPQEKQALLEAQCCKTRKELFLKMLEFAIKTDQVCGQKH